MLKGKKVLITGATSGIGKLTARKLLECGALPIITGRNKLKLEAFSESLPGKHAAYILDVSDDNQVLETVARIEREVGGIDVLLNNAGFGKFESVLNAPLADFREMMDTNYMGVVRCTKAVLPYFTKRGTGHIINVASMAGKIATPKSAGYAATKHAVLGFSNALRLELAGTGITVSAVNPGPVDTPFLDAADPDGTYVDNVSWFIMPPERVVRAIVRVMERRTPEVDLPRKAAIGVKLYQLFPRLSDRIAGKWLNQK